MFINQFYKYIKIKNHPERVLNTKMFVSKYNWDEINYPTSRNDSSKLGKYNLNIALVLLYVDVNVKVFQNNCGKYIDIHKSIIQYYLLKHFEGEKNSDLVNNFRQYTKSKKWI